MRHNTKTKSVSMLFICTDFEIKQYAFSFIFLERWQMPDKASIYKIIKIFCFFLW